MKKKEILNPTKEQKALMLADNERRKREEALAQYSLGQKYDLDLRGQQMEWCLKQDVMSHFTKGCILIEVKEREDAQTYARFLAERCGGMSRTTALNYMTFAKKCIELKKVREFAEGNWSKAIALMHSTTDEQLKEIEEKGLNGKVLGEYDGWTFKDFEKELKKYKDNTDRVIKEETRALDAENKHLIKEVERLKAFDPEGKDVSWSVERMKEIDRIADEFDTAMRKFVHDPRILDHPELQAKVEGIQTRMEKRFRLFVEEWDDYVNGEGK